MFNVLPTWIFFSHMNSRRLSRKCGQKGSKPGYSRCLILRAPIQSNPILSLKMPEASIAWSGGLGCKLGLEEYMHPILPHPLKLWFWDSMILRYTHLISSFLACCTQLCVSRYQNDCSFYNIKRTFKSRSPLLSLHPSPLPLYLWDLSGYTTALNSFTHLSVIRLHRTFTLKHIILLWSNYSMPITQEGLTAYSTTQLNTQTHPQCLRNYSFYVKALQLYHLKQCYTAVRNDLCNNDLNGKIESLEEELSHISMANNFIKTKILICTYRVSSLQRYKIRSGSKDKPIAGTML